MKSSGPYRFWPVGDKRKIRVETVPSTSPGYPGILAGSICLTSQSGWFLIEASRSILSGKAFPNVLLSIGINAHLCALVKNRDFPDERNWNLYVAQNTTEMKIHFSFYEHEKRRRETFLHKHDKTGTQVTY